MHLDQKTLNSLRGKDLIYPTKEDYTTLYVYYRGEVLGSITKLTMDDTIEDIADRMDKLGTGLSTAQTIEFPHLRHKLKEAGVTVEQVIDTEAFREAKNDYNSILQQRLNKHRAELYEYYGVTDNPKADAVYEKAYESGHHAGYGEVSAHFGNLVDLIV